jgi:hypothetical protein
VLGRPERQLLLQLGELAVGQLRQFWIAVDTHGGQIWLSGKEEQENWVDYPPFAQCGWMVAMADGRGAVTLLHDSSSTDLAADTAAAVAAVRIEPGKPASSDV